MIVCFSKHFLRNYFKAPKAVREAFDKQSRFLLQDLHHPQIRHTQIRLQFLTPVLRPGYTLHIE